MRQISESLGFSRTTLTNWLSGQLRDTEGRVAEAVAEWISEQGEEPADWEVIGPAQEEKILPEMEFASRSLKHVRPQL